MEPRFPSEQPPGAVFAVLDPDSGENGDDAVLGWLESALPFLNWRSHIFVTDGSNVRTERFSLDLLKLAAAFLERCGFANLHVHPLVHIRSGDTSQAETWNRLVDVFKPFQEQARAQLTEARLHVAPILAPSRGVSEAGALRPARFFRSRLAIPSFYLPRGILNQLTGRSGSDDTRFYLDSDSRGLIVLLWNSHVFETMLDRIEDDSGSLGSPCGAHLVLDAGRRRVYSCFHAWRRDEAGIDFGDPDLKKPVFPAPPSGGSCLKCFSESVLSMRENIIANRREAEGRKVCFELSLESARRGELTSAAELMHLAYELSVSNEDKVRALIHESLCLRDSGKLQEADDVMAVADGLADDRGEIAYFRGRIQFVWRDYIEALDWFEIALKSGSGKIPVEDMCFEMAQCHVNIGEYPEARPYLDRAEKPEERKAPVSFYRGICDYGENRFESALKFFREARTLGPALDDLGRVLFYIGACLKELEKYDEAVDALRDAVASEPEELANHNLLGFCYYKLKRHEEAVVCFLRAVEIDPGSGIDWANLASNLRDLGRTEEAIKMYKRALSIDPGIGFARDNLKKLTG